MSRAAATQVSAPAVDAARIPLVERFLFYVLLALVCARPVISESFERLELPFLPRASGGVTPATTVWLDSLTLMAASAVLARTWRRERGSGWVLVGLGALMVAVALSVVWAGEQRQALNAGFSLVIAALAGAALVQVMRARWMPRVLLAATLATGVTMATKCVLWKMHEHRDTMEMWAEYKPQLAAAGQDTTAPNVVNFERRLQSGEAIGYQSHPNVTGSLLAMWLLAGVGLWGAWLSAGKTGAVADRLAALLFGGALVLLLGFGLWYTHSVGAFVALAGGLVLLGGLGVFGRYIALRPRRAVVLLGIAYAAVIAAGAAYGIARGTLPHASLAFRWQYWTAGMESFRDAPLTGLGRLNFADAYMRHKSALNPEEVRDPHNFWVSLLVELGPIGLAAGLILIVGSLAAVFRRLDGRADASAGRPAVSIGQVIAGMIVVPMAHLMFGGRVEDAPTAVVWAIEFVSVWWLSFVVLVRLTDLLPDSDAARGWLVAGSTAALLAALIHGLVDFALLTPGGLCAFIALLAAAIAFRPAGQRDEHPPRRKWLLGTAGVVLVLFHIGGVTLPTIRTQFWLDQLTRATFGPADPGELRDLQRRVLASDPLDADAAREVAGLVAATSVRAAAPAQERLKLLAEAEKMGELALQRNPRSRAAEARLGKLYQDLQENFLLAVRPDDASEALRQAALHWQKAVELYPNDPRTRISAGKVWFEWWEESSDSSAATRAAEHFDAALRINAAWPPEEVMRLRPAELEELERYRDELPQ